MPTILRPIIIILCAYLLFNSWLIVSYPEPIVDSSSVRHVDKVIIKQEIYDKSATFTGYNAVKEQTDSTPCQTSSGYEICAEGPLPRIVASNVYRFGTILDVEGYGQYEVQDRTSDKYGTRIDMLFKTYEEAIRFGKKELKYRVLTP